LRTTSEYILWSIEEHEVTIYCTPVEDKVRLWINVDDAIKCEISASIGVKPEGANVTTTITPVKDVWYDEDNLTYHSYGKHKPECKITVSGGYGISEATATPSGNTLSVVSHQHIDFIGNSVYYTTEPHTVNVVVDVFKQTDYKNIILYDGNTTDTTMLYPKTSITQVIDTIGDNLETVLDRLIERIVALESGNSSKTLCQSGHFDSEGLFVTDVFNKSLNSNAMYLVKISIEGYMYSGVLCINDNDMGICATPHFDLSYDGGLASLVISESGLSPDF
jgi:hypothetical protein